MPFLPLIQDRGGFLTGRNFAARDRIRESGDACFPPSEPNTTSRNTFSSSSVAIASANNSELRPFSPQPEHISASNTTANEPDGAKDADLTRNWLALSR